MPPLRLVKFPTNFLLHAKQNKLTKSVLYSTFSQNVFKEIERFLAERLCFFEETLVRWESYTVNCSGCLIFNMSIIIITQSSNISLHVEALLRACTIDPRLPREDELGPPHAWGCHSGCSSPPEKVTRSGSLKIVASNNLWSNDQLLHRWSNALCQHPARVRFFPGCNS